MSRDVSIFPEQVQLLRLLSCTYVEPNDESNPDYLTVESKDVVSFKAFSDLVFRPIFI